jgi:hypothetical protein
LRSVDSSGDKFEKDDAKIRSPASNVSKALLAKRDDFEGPKSNLEYLEGAAGPKGMTSRDRSLTSNISKALLARKG